MTYVVSTGARLDINDRINSDAYYLLMQGDGNLVMYEFGQPDRAVWAAGTNGSDARYAEMQTDGNLVVFNTNRVAKWASNTAHWPGASLLIDDTALWLVASTNERVWRAPSGGVVTGGFGG